MRLWPLIVWFIGDVALMRLTSRYTTRIRSTPRLSNDRVAMRRFQLEFQRKNTSRVSLLPFLSFPPPLLVIFNKILVHSLSSSYTSSYSPLRFLLATLFARLSVREKFGLRRGEESEIGEAKWSIPPQIFYPWKCIKVLVFIHSANVYFVHIYTIFAESICARTVTRTGGGIL